MVIAHKIKARSFRSKRLYVLQIKTARNSLYQKLSFRDGY